MLHAQDDLHPPIYIMPMSVAGLGVYHALKRRGIQASGFLDNNKKITGNAYDGVVIGVPEDLDAASRSKGTVVVCSRRYEDEIVFQLENLGVKSLAYGHAILEHDRGYDAIDDIDHEQVLRCSPGTAKIIEMSGVRKEGLKYFVRYSNSADSFRSEIKDELALHTLEITVTERCTLKCRDCSNLMQYFRHPVDVEAKRVCRSIDVIMDKIDWVLFANVIGGEPFIYKELPAVLRHVSRYSHKVMGSIRVITNGTLIPSDEVVRALRENNVFVMISDYGPNSPKADALVDLFCKNDIAFSRQVLDWQEMAKLLDADLPREEPVEKTFRCCIMSCRQIKGDKFYYCPFLAHGHALKAIPHDEGNFIELDDPSLTKETLKAFVLRQEPFPGCRYCGGYDGSKKHIPSGIQAEGPLPYKAFGP